MTKQFKKILIANRGEIAVRVIKTCRLMGIKAITIYAEDDQHLPHVWMSDESYSLGSGTLKDTYLNIEKILKIAKDAKADAIHPGYGFLSENTEFAQSIESNGVTFIGPTAENIRLMGDKIGSKIEAHRLNIPLIPGYHGDQQSLSFLEKKAQEIGFPVLIKASAGGGGKGMRIVHEPSEFKEALESAQREADKSFNNPMVLLEKYIVNPRHIEVQVMSDTHDQHFHLFERECSIQRRYQKVIEETPAPHLSQELRLKICETAKNIASGIKYRGAGTVEFILAPNNEFYFLEMNTRLQVEHPITEEVLGLDLVSLQIKVAQGEKLNLKQEDIKQNGHAIECRICAENPDAGFLPTSGEIAVIGQPQLKGVRLDCGYQDGSIVGIGYDSMLAKLIVKASHREEAIQMMVQSLDDVIFSGIQSNRSYLKRILKHPSFIKGETHTHFIPLYEKDLQMKEVDESNLAPFLAAFLLKNSFETKNTHKGENQVLDVWQSLGAWRNF